MNKINKKLIIALLVISVIGFNLFSDIRTFRQEKTYLNFITDGDYPVAYFTYKGKTYIERASLEYYTSYSNGTGGKVTITESTEPFTEKYSIDISKVNKRKKIVFVNASANDTILYNCVWGFDNDPDNMFFISPPYSSIESTLFVREDYVEPDNINY